MQGGTVIWTQPKFLSESSYQQYSQHRLETNDLVIATVGSHPDQPNSVVGRATIIPKYAEGALLNQNAVCIRPKDSTLDKRYLGYLGQSCELKNFIAGMARGAANQVRIAIGSLKKFQFTLPPLPTQQRIGEILSKYDNLIDNNNRRIALLEESIHLLYKDWFVRLRFPGYESVKVVDGIPDGWSRVPATQVIDFKPKTPVPKGEIRPYVPMESLSTNSMIINGIETRLVGGGAKFKNGDTLLARITPCLENGKTAFVQFIENDDITATGSTEFIVMRSTQVTPYWVYCLARSYNFRQHAINSMAGSDGRQRVKPECFDRYYILFPPSPILKDFDKIAKPIFKQIHFLTLQNQKLVEARDLLLPRLMNGIITP
jgi:type I restriction enzyme S subunit